MSYADLLTRAREAKPGDTEGARSILATIREVLATEKLESDERRYLYRLIQRWEKRAAGKDARWEVYGSKGGRPRKARRTPQIVERVIKQTIAVPQDPAVAVKLIEDVPVEEFRNEFEGEDSVVASLLKKYGS